MLRRLRTGACASVCTAVRKPSRSGYADPVQIQLALAVHRDMVDPSAFGLPTEVELHRDVIGNALLDVMVGLVPKVAVRESTDRNLGRAALTCAVPLTGDVAGVLRLGMNEPMITCCFKHMTGQESPSEADVYDTLAEVSNMLAGSIVRRLEDLSLVVELGLPMIASEEMAVSSRRPMKYLSFIYEVRGLFFEDQIRATFAFSNSTRWSNGPLSRR